MHLIHKQQKANVTDITTAINILFAAQLIATRRYIYDDFDDKANIAS
jgi:hypothetical protein